MRILLIQNTAKSDSKYSFHGGIKLDASKLQFNSKMVYFKTGAGVIMRILGLILLLYGLFHLVMITLSVSKPGADLKNAFYPFIIYFIFVVIGGILNSNGIKILKRVKNYKKYFDILSAEPTHSIAHLKSSTADPLVQNNVVELIDKGYYARGTYINSDTNCIVFPNEVPAKPEPEPSVVVAEYMAVVCSGCGAVNKVAKGSVGECEYCGSPLK